MRELRPGINPTSAEHLRGSQDAGTSQGTGGVVTEELGVHLDALHELGPEYSDEVAAAFLKRLDLLRPASARTPSTKTLAMVLGSGIPLTAIAGGIAGLPGITVVWLGLLTITWLARQPVSAPAARNP